jgi:hypothetical protein
MAAGQVFSQTTRTVGQGGGYDFATIQSAIDAARTGDSIIVYPGTYVENIQFKGKDIVLRSTDPTDTVTVAATIIDGGGIDSVVAFAGAETFNCILSGFTITNGNALLGGGVAGNRAKPTIKNSTITSNTAKSGGGLYLCWGTIENNTISSNSASIGDGGGLNLCRGLIRNNRIHGNSAGSGGGLSGCIGTIVNNAVYDNKAAIYGGGLSGCDGMIFNNTITSNSAVSRAGGLAFCDGLIRNCIITSNSARDDAQVFHTTPAHSCIQDWRVEGLDNFSSDPVFVSPASGNFRLQSRSPCIDAGVNGYAWDQPQRDLDGNCRLVGDGVDLGCYEYGSKPDTDGDLLSDFDELTSGTNPQVADTDGDALFDGVERLRSSDPLVVTPPRRLRVPHDFPTVQSALSASISGDEIVVSPGVHPENLHLTGVDITLRSEAPEDPVTVESTVLNGRRIGTVVTFQGSETEAFVLAGFTILQGNDTDGGGLFGDSTRATIRNNTIRENLAAEHGGGLALCLGTIRDNTITSNVAGSQGGGLYQCHGNIQGNSITQNTAHGGGGVFFCNGTIQENVIAGNSASGTTYEPPYGGGLARCVGIIRNNSIIGNSANWGGAMSGCGFLIENNIVFGNWAIGGGAMNDCGQSIVGNTIVGNMAQYYGGGLNACGETIRNCIIWGNFAPSDPQIRQSATPTYSCIQDWAGGGEGNISDDPRFTTGVRGSFYLSQTAAGQGAQSPCVDSGSTTAAVLGLTGRTTRTDESPDSGVVDMGYHYYTDLTPTPSRRWTGYP